MRVICLDFDGVIHKYSKGWQNGEIYDEPVQGTKEAIEHIMKNYNVVVSTARPKSQLRDVQEYIWKHLGIHLLVTNEKPCAEIYIDDRGLKFNNWEETLKLL